MIHTLDDTQNSTNLDHLTDPLAGHRYRHARALFWLCYVWDKDISLRSGRPPLLIGDYCDLSPPETSGMLAMTSSNTDSACELLAYHLLGDPYLSKIKEDAYRLLYSTRAFRTSDSQLIQNIRQLDDELERWRLSIPLQTRPRLSIPPSRPLLSHDTSTGQKIRYIDLQLEYHYTLTAIHTPVRRCGGGTSENERLPDDLHSVVHSSIDISLEASRSTLLFLKEPIDLLEEEALRSVPRES